MRPMYHGDWDGRTSLDGTIEFDLVYPTTQT